jgi:hypothetical protein
MRVSIPRNTTFDTIGLELSVRAVSRRPWWRRVGRLAAIRAVTTLQLKAAQVIQFPGGNATWLV